MRDTVRRHRAETGTMAPAGSVLAAATTDSAAAIGLASSVGALTPGHRADLILLSGLAHVRGDVSSALVTTAGPADVHTVLVDGQVVKRAGRLTSLDLPKLREAAVALAIRATDH
jgi:5-methylthioadenosine/S-adenosylhomocysteine deaminase